MVTRFPLFKGATRVPTVAGVPLIPAVVLVMTVASATVLLGFGWLALLVPAPPAAYCVPVTTPAASAGSSLTTSCDPAGSGRISRPRIPARPLRERAARLPARRRESAARAFVVSVVVRRAAAESSPTSTSRPTRNGCCSSRTCLVRNMSSPSKSRRRSNWREPPCMSRH